MSIIRDEFISSLLQNPEQPAKAGGPKIGVVGEEVSEVDDSTLPPPPEKTMLELMMEEQNEAKKEKVVADEKAKDAMTKNIGSGFKKGFFGGGSKAKAAPVKAAAAKVVTKKAEVKVVDDKSIKTLSKPKASAQLATKQTSLVLDDVQDAMKGDNPMIEKLKEGEWMTPSLTQDIAANPILVNGLRNPKCMAAIKMMQENPKEAEKKFKNDAEVNTFLMEYGRVMSTHFEAMGKAQQPPPAAAASAQPMQEVGPLHAATLKREKEREGAAAKANTKSSTGSSSSKGKSTDEVDAERVKKITEDKELSGLLMDVELQKVLQECNDPVKFQKHIRNPVTAAKIKKLFDAGLVGTAQ